MNDLLMEGYRLIQRENEKRERRRLEKKIRETRRNGLIETVEWYCDVLDTYPEHRLSQEQIEQLIEVRDRLNVFGELGQMWAGLADELLQENAQKFNYEIVRKSKYYDND